MTTTTHFLLPLNSRYALCGQPPDPIDLGPYRGRVTCKHCWSIGLEGVYSIMVDGPRSKFFSAAGEIKVRS